MQHGALGLRARSTVVLGRLFRAAWLRSGCGRYSTCIARFCSGCGRLFRAARLRSGCRRCSAQHGCAPVAGGILRSMVALWLQAVFRTRGTVVHGLRAAIPRSTVALWLRAVFRTCSTVLLGLQAAIPRSTVALRLQVVFRARGTVIYLFSLIDLFRKLSLQNHSMALHYAPQALSLKFLC
ncbi:hypothetical protein B0H14DRAFT_2608208 [Mycena olivaceomarginata]|nr:hypothetical protein B0H14DRAFT_2608208 [Mycena olivaceomarginata]